MIRGKEALRAPHPHPRRLAVVPPQRPLKLAYILDDGLILPQPPIQRAVNDTVNALRSAGHEIVAWDASVLASHASAYTTLWLPAILADGGARCAELCRLVDEPLLAGMLVGRSADALTLAQRQDLEDRVWQYQRGYLQAWTASGVDALLAPVVPWVGMRPGEWARSEQCCAYTAQWNLLNYAALVVPAVVVDRELDRPDEAWRAHTARSFADQFNHDLYDVELVHGMPVGVQIVGGRFGEEKVVAVAKVIQSLQAQANGISS